MDGRIIALIAVGLLAVAVMMWVGYLLDRRSQRRASAQWMRNWTIRTRVLSDLIRRWQGPLRLEDRSAVPAPDTPKRKFALRRRKRSTKG